MDTATRRRIAQTTAEDLHRLCHQAEAKGIRILLTADGEHFATSTSNPITLHRVSRRGCDCKAFMAWQRCSHHSLLLAQLGALPDLAPEIEQPEPCHECRGSGVTRAYVGGRLSDWIALPCSCTRQHAA